MKILPITLNNNSNSNPKINRNNNVQHYPAYEFPFSDVFFRGNNAGVEAYFEEADNDKSFSKPRSLGYLKPPVATSEKVKKDAKYDELVKKYLEPNVLGTPRMFLILQSHRTALYLEQAYKELENYPDILKQSFTIPKKDGSLPLHVVTNGKLVRHINTLFKDDPQALCKMYLTKNKSGKYPEQTVQSSDALFIMRQKVKTLMVLCPEYRAELAEVYGV